MELLTTRIVETQIKKGKIKREEKELYQYGYRIMLEKAIAFLLTIAVALVLDAWMEILVFCVAFISIRIYAGGFHAKTVTGCMILSSVMLVVGVLLNGILLNCKFYSFFVFVDIVILPIICIFAPAEHKNRPVSLSEKRYFKRMVCMFCILHGLFDIVLCLIKRYELVGMIVYAHWMVILSLIISKKWLNQGK